MRPTRRMMCRFDAMTHPDPITDTGFADDQDLINLSEEVARALITSALTQRADITPMKESA